MPYQVWPIGIVQKSEISQRPFKLSKSGTKEENTLKFKTCNSYSFAPHEVFFLNITDDLPRIFNVSCLTWEASPDHSEAAVVWHDPGSNYSYNLFIKVNKSFAVTEVFCLNIKSYAGFTMKSSLCKFYNMHIILRWNYNVPAVLIEFLVFEYFALSKFA